MNKLRKEREAKPGATTLRATQRRQKLRVSLIKAAEKVVSAKGVAGINARELAETAGCALGAIYNVFPNLDAIVFEVNSRTLAMFEAFAARRGRALSGEANSEAAVAGLVGLAEAYLDFAVAHQPRWRALFEHVEEPGGLPESYLADQARLFTLVEKPLAALRPDLDDKRRKLFARTMFSAVHGIVSLSLDAKLVSLPVTVLGDQVRMFIGVLSAGLIADAPPARRSRRG